MFSSKLLSLFLQFLSCCTTYFSIVRALNPNGIRIETSPKSGGNLIYTSTFRRLTPCLLTINKSLSALNKQLSLTSLSIQRPLTNSNNISLECDRPTFVFSFSVIQHLDFSTFSWAPSTRDNAQYQK